MPGRNLLMRRIDACPSHMNTQQEPTVVNPTRASLHLILLLLLHLAVAASDPALWLKEEDVLIRTAYCSNRMHRPLSLVLPRVKRVTTSEEKRQQRRRPHSLLVCPSELTAADRKQLTRRVRRFSEESKVSECGSVVGITIPALPLLSVAPC